MQSCARPASSCGAAACYDSTRASTSTGRGRQRGRTTRVTADLVDSGHIAEQETERRPSSNNRSRDSLQREIYKRKLTAPLSGEFMQPTEDRPDRSQEPESWTRSFWALIATQFQGAFSDNAYKNLVVYLILGVALPKDQREILVVIVGLLFSIPFILFSMTGGFLGDRFSKRSVTAGTKVMEIGRSEEHTSELQSLTNLVCRLLLEKKKKKKRS